MDKNHIDKIFQNGLKSDLSFENAEGQWKRLRDRLYGKKRRVTVLALSTLLTTVIGALVIFIFVNSEHTDISKIEFNSVTDQRNEGMRETQYSLIEDGSKSQSQSATIISDDPKENMPLAPHTEPNAERAISDSSAYQSIESDPNSDNSKPSYSTVDLVRNEGNQLLNSTDKTTSKIELRLTEVTNLEKRKISFLFWNRQIVSTMTFLTTNPVEIFDEGKQNNFVHISIGAQNDWVSHRQMIDSTAWNFGLNVKFNLRKGWSFMVGYSKQHINRTFDNHYDYYNYGRLYPDVYAPEYAELENGTHYLTLRNHNLDFGFSYPILSSNIFDIEGLGGVQFNNFEATRLRLVYESPYGVVESFLELPGHGFRMTDVYLGAEINFPVYDLFGLVISYKYYQMTDTSFYRWNNRHRLFAGMSYRF